MGNTTAEAYRRLYADNFGLLLRYALRRVKSPEDAADVVAETFLIAWRRYDEMPSGDQARLWLYGVARNVLANHGRVEQRRERLGERLQLELREHLTRYDPTADLLEERATREALAALEHHDREVLELTVWEQLTPTEIAVALGLRSEVVRTRLSRARARMRKRLSRNDRGARRHEPGVRTASVPKEGKA
ncbi:RNA polymerase sigma factor [Kineosporia babensis]|uniref:Sigma-70 family RNA polymerase sigma factor n=1 Tax=Kineosporia babensis TaxID=499548 RepID=A0A9X1N8X8_9ACTN|nr:sigma-70 family RNA polymerase sigma factor [Kineosporia babensis]